MSANQRERRRCAACRDDWYCETGCPFVTCPGCQRPIVGDCGGGCRYWQAAAADVRVMKVDGFSVEESR